MTVLPDVMETALMGNLKDKSYMNRKGFTQAFR